MVSSLVNDAKGRLHRVAFVVQRDDLHDVGVSNADRRRVGQRDDVLMGFRLSDERNDFQDIVVEHEHNEGPCLP